MKATLLQSLKDLVYAVSDKMPMSKFWQVELAIHLPCLIFVHESLNVNLHASHNILCRVLRASFLSFQRICNLEIKLTIIVFARLMAGSEGWTFIIARAHIQTIWASIIKRIILLFNRSKGFLKRWDASGQFPQCAAPFQNQADSPKVCNTPNTNGSNGIVK